MSILVRQSDHEEWERLNLADYCDFSEKVTECNQEHLADCTSGEWFYAPDLPVENEDGTFKVIYTGSWGNYNTPGASAYTYATLYDESNPEDLADYEESLRDWQRVPEWAESDEEDSDEEDEDSEEE